MIKLYGHQLNVLKKIKNGCILCGDVGSGKSITSLSYYYLKNGGSIDTLRGGDYIPMKNPKDLYIITTATKRNRMEWEEEMIPFLLSVTNESGPYSNVVVVDSWNNIKKYVEVTNAFFIFDEDRVTGYGAWTKAFLEIAKHNEWILLSATPGDKWVDYMPVFIANGFYKHKTHFNHEHVIYSRFSKYPKIDRYINTGMLVRHRNDILVTMPMVRKTVPHHEDIYVEYDVGLYKSITKERWNPWEDKPIKNASELCYSMRRAVNSSDGRQVAILEIFEKHPKLIIFYNFNYELDILRSMYFGDDVEVAEWNGHYHQPIPTSDRWVYLVQYTSGAEGWNCITTDTIIFFSQNYSYRVLKQSCGRIDRLNTPYKDLYYYHLKSRSGIDLAISKALKNKKDFNERIWVSGQE